MEIKNKCCKSGRPREFDLDEALERALHVFWRKGYEGTSLTDLTEAVGVNRPSLYAAFGNKEELFRKVLERYVSRSASCAAEAMDEPTARRAIERLLGSGVETLDGDRPKGCLLVQGALTCSEASEPVRQELSRQRQAAEMMLRQRLERAVSEGELAAATDCPGLARYFATIMHGMSVQAATGATPEQFREVIRLAMQAWPS